jgi:hypothetical protein
MRLAHNPQTHFVLEQPQAGLPVLWGLAARAQTQIFPGASALTAPHQQFCGLVHGGPAC